MKRFKKLKIFRLISGLITDESVKENLSLMPTLDSIEEVSFKNSGKLTNKTIEFFTKFIPNTKRFYLKNFWNIGEAGISLLSSFKFLEKLFLGPSLIDYNSLKHLSNTNLKVLFLSKCFKLENLPSIKSLHSLTIKNHSKIFNSFETIINKEKFPNLKCFYFPNSNLEDKHLEFLCKDFASQVEVLSINYCKKITLRSIKNIELLTKLVTFNSRFLGESKEALKINWPKTIKQFDTRYSKIGDQFCSSLSGNQLEYLDIQFSDVTDKGIVNILNNSWKTLKILRIKFCDNLTNKSKRKIFSKCTNLEKLTVAEVEMKDFKKLNFHKIVSLKLYQTEVDNRELKKIIPKLENLKRLQFTAKIDDNILNLISNHCKDLTKLDISSDIITEEGFSYISRLNPKLKMLDLSRCTSLTESGFKSILEHNPTIKKLKFYHCNNLGFMCLKYIENSFG